MKFLIRALLILGFVWVAAPATAQFNGCGGGMCPPLKQAAAAPYTGPGDVVSGAAAWWGLRGYNGTFSGTVGQICDQSTGLVCANMTWTAVGGLVLPTIGGNACNNSTNICVVASLADQTGNGFTASQSTNANRPVLKTNCLSTFPCIDIAATSTTNLTATFSSAATGAFSMSVVVNQLATPGPYENIISAENVGGSVTVGTVGHTPSADQLYIFTQGSTPVTQLGTDGTFVAVQGVLNGTSSVLTINSTDQTGTLTAQNLSSATSIQIGTEPLGGPSQGDGPVTELGVWPLGFSSGQRTSLNSNQRAYWGF